MTTENKSQKIISRSIRDDNDFWLVRNLLIETHSITPPDFNWEIRRWDGSFFHNEEAGWDARWGKDAVRLWESGDGKLVGAAHPESSGGDCYLQIHPDYRHLEEEMIEWAEGHLTRPVKDSEKHQLMFDVYEYDIHRQRILEKRGYEKLPNWFVIRRLRLGNKVIPQGTVADGYTLRSTETNDISECKKIADLLNAGFNRTIHTAKEVKTFHEKSPSYRKDLDLFVETPDGILASHVGITYDEKNRFGLIEPVCTHPDHRRKGLASALILEGIHRVKALGALDIYVGTGEKEPANKLYESVGFTEVYKGHVWRRMF